MSAETVDDLTKAWRRSASLKAAIDAGRHACWCGSFGAFRCDPKGPWLCPEHVVFDATGSFKPLPHS